MVNACGWVVTDKWNNFSGCCTGVPKNVYDMSLFRGNGICFQTESNHPQAKVLT
jgi:hypothetical protein